MDWLEHPVYLGGRGPGSFVVALPLMIKTTRAAMESVDQQLINASYTLGHGEFTTALKVILPLSRKGMIAGAVLSFARAMGEFGATLMVAGNIPGKTDTMPLAIYSAASSGNWHQANTMVIFFTLISAIFCISPTTSAERFSDGVVSKVDQASNGFYP